MDKMFMRAFSRKRSATGSVPVYLNVYDLTPINGYAYWLGLGVYHSGVQVHGVEYAYGAHDRPSSGIFEGEPRRCPGFRYRTSVLVGRTDLGPREVASLMDDLAKVYAGNAYHLISKNCNHFCNDVCVRLTGEGIPGWVNRLANLGFLCNCVLPSAINGAAIRQKVPSAATSASGQPGLDEEKGRLMDAARKENEEKLRRQAEEEEESNRLKAQAQIHTAQKKLGLAMRRSVSSSARCVPSFCFTSSGFSSKDDADAPAPLPPTSAAAKTDTQADPAATAGSEQGPAASPAKAGGRVAGGGTKAGGRRRSRRSASTSSSSRTSLVVAA